MKREIKIIFVLGILILIILPITSAGWWEDFKATITGKGSAPIPVSLNISVTGGNAPVITHVYNATMTDVSSQLNEGPSSTDVLINFSVSDAEGYSNLNDSTAYINYTKAGQDTRSVTCTRITAESSGLLANYTCNVSMWWWDSGGTWDIKAYIEDINDNQVMNDSTDFYVGTFGGFYAAPSSLEWSGGIAPGSTNEQATNNPLVLNNSGNLVRNIQMNSTNLLGETNSDLGLWAGNFTVDETNACDAGPAMVGGEFTAITGSSLPVGNYSDGSSGKENLYVCLETAGAELDAQAYSTKDEGAWTLKILA